MDQYQYGIARKVLCGTILTSLGILGFIGNILSIIVFTRRSMKSNIDLVFCGMLFTQRIIFSRIQSVVDLSVTPCFKTILYSAFLKKMIFWQFMKQNEVASRWNIVL